MLEILNSIYQYNNIYKIFINIYIYFRTYRLSFASTESNIFEQTNLKGWIKRILIVKDISDKNGT